MPKFELLRTMPRPKWCCQIRLAITRAGSGLSGETSQRASAVRRPEVFASAAGVGITGSFALRIDGNAGPTLFSGFFSACGLPR